MLALIQNNVIVAEVSEGGGFTHDGDYTIPAYAGWSNDAGYSLVTIAPASPTPTGQVIAGTSVQMVNNVPTYVNTYVPAPEPTVPKSIVMARIIAANMMSQAYQGLTAQPNLFARWFAPDHPDVLCNDPDAISFVQALGLDPNVILAPQ